MSTFVEFREFGMAVAKYAVYRLIGIDDFIANLWRIHVEVKREGYVQVHLVFQQLLLHLANRT